MLVVIGTDIGIVLNFTTSGSSFSTAATVVRAFRIMRIIRLVRTQQNIKIILDTLVNIIPQITNFIALMFLLLFIYAALGINLFSGVVLQDLVTEKNNFKYWHCHHLLVQMLHRRRLEQDYARALLVS